jgi:enterochelin esterase-like enzyme
VTPRYQRLPPLASLRTFEAVARLSSFTKAAKELGITQSAVSHQIRALEEQLGVLLFHRHNPGIEPSADGRTLALGVANGLDAILLAYDLIRQRSSPAGTAMASSPPPRNTAAGTVMEGLSLRSELLGCDVRYSIYLPPDYDGAGTRRYPVTYLLHAFPQEQDSAADSSWIALGSADQVADCAIENRQIPPMILLMPDSKRSCWINAHDGAFRYEDMFVRELIAHVDSNYRTRRAREFRALAGFSMGGFGSLAVAMRNPECFSACAALSPALSTDDELIATAAETYATYYGAAFGPGLLGAQRLTAHWYEHAPLQLARTLPVERLQRTRWYLDVGDADPLYRANNLLHIALRDRNVRHEFRVRAGGHDWAYSRSGLPEALSFIGRSFLGAT